MAAQVFHELAICSLINNFLFLNRFISSKKKIIDCDSQIFFFLNTWQKLGSKIINTILKIFNSKWVYIMSIYKTFVWSKRPLTLELQSLVLLLHFKQRHLSKLEFFSKKLQYKNIQLGYDSHEYVFSTVLGLNKHS